MSDIIVRVGPQGNPKWQRTVSPEWNSDIFVTEKQSLEFDLAEGDRVLIDVPLHKMSVVISEKGVLLRPLVLIDK